MLVLRGLIDNSFKKTAQFIKSLSNNGAQAIIDPLSFKRFNINQVPQIVVISDDHNCYMGRCSQTPLHDKISGNISLHYALERISSEGEYSNEVAKRLLGYITAEPPTVNTLETN